MKLCGSLYCCKPEWYCIYFWNLTNQINQIKYIFATKNNNIENIQGIIKSKEAQKKPKGL
jgi:hypothetical protein